MRKGFALDVTLLIGAIVLAGLMIAGAVAYRSFYGPVVPQTGQNENLPVPTPEPEITSVSGTIKKIENNEITIMVEAAPGDVPGQAQVPREYILAVASETLIKQRVLKSEEEMREYFSETRPEGSQPQYLTEDKPYNYADLKVGQYVQAIGKLQAGSSLKINLSELIVLAKPGTPSGYLPGDPIPAPPPIQPGQNN